MNSITSPEKINTFVPSIDYKEHTLDNGLKIVLCRFGNIPSTAVNISFHTGSKDEDENKTGVAHLFEHLMFEGSPNFPKGSFDRILGQYGGESNAYTSWDSTSYYIVIPSNHIETAFWLDSDRLSGFNISEEELEIQKDVVLEEKLLHSDNSPYGSLEEESSKRLFKKSGYRWPIIGDMEQLKNVSLDEIKSFFYRHYNPGNAVISVAGDIDYDKTLKMIEKYYGGLKPGNEIQRKPFIEDEIESEIRSDIYDNVQLYGKFFFYRVPKPGTREYYAMSILNGILSDGESSKLNYELEYKSKLVSEIDSYLSGLEDVSIFSIFALVMDKKDPEEVENKINKILNDVRSGQISEKEILKVKNKIETVFSLKRQSIVQLADKFSYLKTFYGDCSKINYEILEYLSVTKDDIVEAANKFLNNNQRVVLNYLPKKINGNYKN